MKVFLLKSGNLISSIEHSFGSPNYSNHTRKKKSKVTKLEGKRKFCNYMQMIRKLYIENPKDSTQKQLELINKFSEAAVYKIHI